ncbi:MAG: redox-regulated ATPase YchF [Anaerolineales bacterium]|nr:redox-regulated ATPase YchF [Anaerolineales bacterium]
MKIGIVGLPNSTKTTIFNALTHSQVETAVTSSGKVEVHTAMVDVPDPRVDILREMYKPRKTTFARVQYNDVAGLKVGSGKDGTLSGQLLNTISQSDALLHVVRAFEDDRIPHPEGKVDALRDLAALDFEFLISDLQIVERRLERLAHDLDRKGTYPERPGDQAEFDLLTRIKEGLEEEKPIRTLNFSALEEKTLRGYQFLTAKPALIVLNVGDEGSDNPEDFPYNQNNKEEIICLHGSLEMEIAQLSREDAELFMVEFGINEPGLKRMIRLNYDLLGLQSFFTVGEDEVRAWTIPQGATVVEAAGVIHSDLERGFIRAEVVGYQDLIDAGSYAEARKRGTVRLEGRDYHVKDGDILNIRFNV